jgi:hypothetical protein
LTSNRALLAMTRAILEKPTGVRIRKSALVELFKYEVVVFMLMPCTAQGCKFSGVGERATEVRHCAVYQQGATYLKASLSVCSSSRVALF